MFLDYCCSWIVQLNLKQIILFTNGLIKNKKNIKTVSYRGVKYDIYKTLTFKSQTSNYRYKNK